MVIELFDAGPTVLGQGAARLLRGGTRSGPPASVPPTSTLYADFTVDFDRARPKLQRGTYLLGLVPGAWQRPWRMRAAGTPGAPLARKASVVVSVEPLAADDPRRADGSPTAGEG